MAGQAHGFFGNLLGDAADFKNDPARLDNCDIMIDCTFTATHAGLGWLGSNWFVREDANPHFTTAVYEGGERDRRGLNLAGLQQAQLQGLQTGLSEGENGTQRCCPPYTD